MDPHCSPSWQLADRNRELGPDLILTLWRGICEHQVLQTLLHHLHHKLRPAAVLADGTAVAAAAVVGPQAPVDAGGLVAHWVECRGTVEVRHLVGQELPYSMEDQATHPEHVEALSTLDDAGNLFDLVPLNVDPPEDSEGAELLVTGALELMQWAQHRLVLEEHALGPDGTGKVVDIGAADAVAAVCGPRLLAEPALGEQAPMECNFHIDEGPALGLIHLCGPKGAIEVHPQVQVQVQEACWAIGGPVPFLVAKAALPQVTWHFLGPKGGGQALHKFGNLPLPIPLGAPLLDGDEEAQPFPAHPFPLLQPGLVLLAVLQGPGAGLDFGWGLWRLLLRGGRWGRRGRERQQRLWLRDWLGDPGRAGWGRGKRGEGRGWLFGKCQELPHVQVGNVVDVAVLGSLFWSWTFLQQREMFCLEKSPQTRRPKLYLGAYYSEDLVDINQAL